MGKITVMSPIEKEHKCSTGSKVENQAAESGNNADNKDPDFRGSISDDDSFNWSSTAMEIDRAHRQRAHVEKKMLRIKDMLSENVPSPATPKLIVLSKTIPVVYAEYSKIHSRIVAIVAEDVRKKEEETYEKFEEIYYSVSSKVEEKLLAANDRVTERTKSSFTSTLVKQPTSAHVPTTMVKSEWNVHNATKAVQYLINNWGNGDVRKALLGNEDEIVVASSNCQDRYKEVLNVLMGSANDKGVLVETHIRGMANLHKMEADSKDELAVLLNEVTRHVDSLYYLEQEVTGVTEQFVVNLISSSLSDTIRQSWEKTRSFGELSKLPEMIKFLRSLYSVKRPSQPPRYPQNRSSNSQTKPF